MRTAITLGLVLTACGPAPPPAPAPQPSATADVEPTAPPPEPVMAEPAPTAAPRAPRPVFKGGPSRSPELEEIEALVHAGRHREAGKAAEAMLRKGDELSLDVRLHAHAVIGHVASTTGRAAGADRAYQRVIALFEDGADEFQNLPKRKMGHALYAVGEAHYHFAEKQRRKVEAIKLPAVRQGKTPDEVNKTFRTKFAPWMRKKRPAMAAAEKAYLKVVKIKPVPPPGWVVAAGARVGDMHAAFARDLLSAPYPSDWDKPGDIPGSNPPVARAAIKKLYQDLVADMSRPLWRRARAAYKNCLGFSRKLNVDSDDTRHCRAELAKLPEP